ncbi:MAG TPA: anti-sigma regulatory factor [Pseudonocardiaceae bacterium]|nr:anti-sigma regulatory factor [Pseudonocardiaceae bacterium]
MTDLLSNVTVAIAEEIDIVHVRQSARQAAVAAGLSLVQQTKLVTAASELARNALIHGNGGQAEITVEHTPPTTTVALTFTDSGPGIADIDQALSDGFTTGNGLGLGLGGARRLADRFDIHSVPGQGTTVRIGFTVRRKPGS